MEDGRQDMECFAARLWDQKDKMGLDVEDIAYGTSTFSPSNLLTLSFMFP